MYFYAGSNQGLFQVNGGWERGKEIEKNSQVILIELGDLLVMRSQITPSAADVTGSTTN